MIRTYLDSGALIQAWRGGDVAKNRARKLLFESGRTFVAIRVRMLETLARVRGPRMGVERGFYLTFFDVVASIYLPLDEAVGENAERLASRWGLEAADALHIALAIAGGCHEFVTTEGPPKPMHRVTEIRVVHLSPDSQN